MGQKQKFDYKNIQDLQLDVCNPRLPKSKQGKDQHVIIEYLLLEASTVELMESIGENGFFAGEMLLVVPDEHNKDKYIVVEGNRRLTAVMLLNNPQLASVKKVATREVSENAKYKPTELPCLVFNNRSEIQQFLGFVHITGKKSWRLLEKARYLHDLRHSEKFKDLSLSEASKEMARIIGSKSPYVKKMLISYGLYEIIEDEKFYQIDGLSDSTFFLNYFSDGLQKENIKAFLNVDVYSEQPLDGLNKDHLRELSSWWFEKSGGVSRVIGDSEGMKMLNMVLGNEIALDAFRKGASIYSAYELTEDVDFQFENKIRESLQAIELADGLVHKVKAFYIGLDDDLRSIRQLIVKINDFKKRLEQYDDDF